MSIKKKTLILKYFYNEEKQGVFIVFLSISFILAYVFVSNSFFCSKLITAIYDVSIAFLIGAILYFSQVFLPKIRKRENAQRELNIIINSLVDLIRLIIVNYYPEEELSKIRFYNNPQKYIFENKDEVSERIADKLKLNDVMEFKWNKKRLTFSDEFTDVINKFSVDYREIMLKYGDCLEENTLSSLEKIYRNYIFISFRENRKIFSQENINKIIVKKLLKNMHNVQKTADRINNFTK